MRVCNESVMANATQQQGYRVCLLIKILLNNFNNIGTYIFRRENGKRLKSKSSRTKRALDAGDSAAFSSNFLASSFSCSQAESGCRACRDTHPPQRYYTYRYISLCFLRCDSGNNSASDSSGELLLLVKGLGRIWCL